MALREYVSGRAVLAGASSFAAITDWLHDLDEQSRSRLGFWLSTRSGWRGRFRVYMRAWRRPAIVPAASVVTMTAVRTRIAVMEISSGHPACLEQSR